MLEERRQETAVAVRAEVEPAPPPPNAYRDPVTWAVVVAASGAYLALSLFRLLQLTPSSWDLGIFTEYVKQFANLRAPIVDVRGPGFNLLGEHFHVIVALIAPFFRVFPSPATLLAAQALLTAVSVFPVTQAATALIGQGTGRAVGAAYGFSWGLQQMIDFDFHEIAFAVPLLAFSLSALIRGRTRAAVLWAVPLVFVKEDQGFTVAAIGLLMLLAGGRPDGAGGRGWSRMIRLRVIRLRMIRLRMIRGSVPGGLFLVVWGLAWSLLAIMVIIPHFNPNHRYEFWSHGGVIGSGAPFSVTGLVRQTLYAWPVKLQTVVLLLLPTAFIAVGSPLALIAVPSLALRFISTDSAYWGTLWHYNATVMPVLFIAAVDAIARWRAMPSPEPPGAEAAGGAGGAVGRWRVTGFRPPPGLRPAFGARWRALRAAAARHGAAMMLAAAVALAFQFPLSNLWHGTTYEIGPHVAAADAAMARVPDGATVQTTLGLLAPLAARTDTFWIGNAGNPATQYIVFDGLNSGYSPPPANVPAFIRQLYPNDGYRQIFARDHVYVFRRG
jgi:uncharacterized membrane protein